MLASKQMVDDWYTAVLFFAFLDARDPSEGAAFTVYVMAQVGVDKSLGPMTHCPDLRHHVPRFEKLRDGGPNNSMYCRAQ